MTGDRCSIAIVDDDGPVLKSLSRLLRGRGFEVKTYESAAEFLVAARAERPDGLVVDHQMPGMTGLELLHKLAQQGLRIPAIVITAHADGDMSERCAEAGAVACLFKPLQLPALLAALDLARRGVA
jgi:FixJ family two-component response regulator